MKTRIASGILLVIFGLILSLGPQYLFTPCNPAHGDMPMRCWWTARVEIGIGLAVAFGGLLIMLRVSAAFRAGVAAMVFALLVLAAAVPLALVGVCQSETMHCRMAMLPALLVAAGLTGLLAFGVCLVNWKKEQ